MRSLMPMTDYLEQFAVMERFYCLGAHCPDTCCRGWDMPADAPQLARYQEKAPELLAIVDADAKILKRDSVNQHCAQLCEGICSIHARYGTELLGDACYFYPRMLNNIGGKLVMSGAISCPEMLRLIMQTPNPYTRITTSTDRLPVHRRNLLPDGWSSEALDAVVNAALACAADVSIPPEVSMERLLALAEALEHSTADDWPMRWQQAVANAPAAIASDGDSHALYYALALTEAFGAPGISQKLAGIMQRMEEALGCRFDRTSREMEFLDTAQGAQARLRARWQRDAQAALAPMLHRWLQAQVSMTMFPFGGFHAIRFAKRGAVMVQRFATMRLALMCHVPVNAAAPDEQQVMDVMQGLSRFMDHLADAKLTMMIHRDSGWESPARLRGLLG